MGASGTLARKIDADLVERILSSGKIERKEPAKKKDRTPRPADSYRGARRNASRGDGFQGMNLHRPELLEYIAPAAYLNRSDKWTRAMTYGYAREIGPSKEPVR